MNTADIDLPRLKEILWHKLRDDLKNYIPAIADTDLLLCPTCCRFLPIEDFSVEHVIPQQSLDDDPPEVRAAISRNLRSATTLLCNKQLLKKGKTIHPKGCNSWKGKFYDKSLRGIFNSKVMRTNTFTSRHHVALFSACYLGLFERYGFQVALVPSGLIMRKQFFNPDRFNKDVPASCQMTLMGDPQIAYDKQSEKYWVPPFKFSIEQNFCTVGVRNTSMRLPLSRDPEIPLARKLAFVPPKYAFRLNFQPFFE